MNVIKEVAKQNKTTPYEVKREISFAIQQGFNNPDPQIQAVWKRLFPDGKQPSPEEFIKVLSHEIVNGGVI